MNLPIGDLKVDELKVKGDAIREKRVPGLRPRHQAQRTATTSISTRASFGNRAACTVERAGGAAVK